MKALLLAAGLGTRLAPLTNDKPKALIPVNGKPILIKQIENLHENGVYDITIVSGYKHSILKKTILDNWPDIKIVNSVNYAETNNMYSAYLGIKSMFPDGIIGSFFMMNSDVFFDASVLTGLIEFTAPDAVVVDFGHYIEESMKVIENNGRLISISKQISSKEALGSSIDIYKFSSFGAKAFYDKCVEYIEEKKELKKWSEVALNDAFEDVVFRACPLTGRWYEIDNMQDLLAAEKLFSQEQ